MTLRPANNAVPNGSTVILPARQPITALYERLSRDDEVTGDSNSILNQKSYLEAYASQHGFLNCVHYTDDGWSGGNFDRPNWKRLIVDIEAGKVGTVLVKDMSRIGRDYLQTGYYTEVIFRKYNVRFIAVSNGIDSADPNSSEFAPFMNIMNEWYLRDLSRKQKAAVRTKGESGKPTTTSPIYGYKSDPNDKYHWLIDEEAAAVVRRIFQLCVEGHGTGEIARILYEDKVDIPSVYRAKQGRGLWKSRTEFPNPYNWKPYCISCMLSKQEYAGDTVNFRRTNISYKDKKQVKNPPEEWLIFENTHEPIIDRETWELVQKLRGTRRRTDTLGVANPLTGLVFCADCGAKMYNSRKRPYDANNLAGDSYNCSTYQLGQENHRSACGGHYITTKALHTLILDAIRAVSASAMTDRDAFAKKVQQAAQVKRAESIKDTQRKLAKDKRRCSELDQVIKKLYESYAVGRISDERFDDLLAEYEIEQKNLRDAIEKAEQEVADFMESNENIGQFFALVEKYTDFSELTPTMLNEFIDKVLVHAPVKENSQRTQEIEIYFNFIGKIDIPTAKPTEAELAEEARLEKERIRSRKRYQQRKERAKAAAQSTT